MMGEMQCVSKLPVYCVAKFLILIIRDPSVGPTCQTSGVLCGEISDLDY